MAMATTAVTGRAFTDGVETRGGAICDGVAEGELGLPVLRPRCAAGVGDWQHSLTGITNVPAGADGLLAVPAGSCCCSKLNVIRRLGRGTPCIFNSPRTWGRRRAGHPHRQSPFWVRR